MNTRRSGRAAARSLLSRLLSLSLALAPLAIQAESNGINGYSGNPAINSGSVCTSCHFGGSFDYTDGLTGPATLARSASQSYTLFADLASGGAADSAGFNLSTTRGSLSASAGQIVENSELTHSAPQTPGNFSWTISYTAPATLGTSTFYWCVNLVNGTGSTDGDNPVCDSRQINVVNIPPDARNDSLATSEASTLNGNLFSNNGSGADSDADGDAITVTAVNGNGGDVGNQIPLGSGLLTVNANGTMSFNPNGGYESLGTGNTAMEAFNYTIGDGFGGSDMATATIVINGINDNPVADNDAGSTNEDVPVVIAVLNGDTDAEDTVPAGAVVIVSNGAIGNASVNGDRTVTYTPGANLNGNDSFTYNVRDSENAVSNTATVNVTVMAVNDAPQAGNDGATTDEDTTVEVSVLANDTDVEDGTPGGAVTIVANAGNGNAVVTASRTINYTPDLNYFGPDSFTYRVRDNSGTLSNIATVNITVDPVNDPPTTVADNAMTNEDMSVMIDVLANDSDVDGSIDATTVMISSAAANGMTSVDPVSGVVTYNPDMNYTGADAFAYTVRDNTGAQSSPATVSINVIGDNDPPVAVDDMASTPEDMAVTINVKANDTDAEDGIPAGAVTLSSQPANGMAVVNGDNTVTYTPDSNYNGGDGFSYVVRDTEGLMSAAATVSITVNSVNDAPTVVTPIADQMVVVYETFGPLDVSGNFDDVDAGDSLSFALSGQPAGLGIDAMSGIISGEATQTGLFTATVTVTDLGGAMASDSFDIDVAQGPVSFDGTTLTYMPTASSDQPIFSLAGNGDLIVEYGSGPVQFSGVQQIVVNGDGGDDTVTLDFGNGNPVPVGGLSFAGGGPGDNDLLALTAGNAVRIEYGYIDASSGSIDVDGRVITYTGLEPIIDMLVAQDRVFVYSDGTDQILLSDDDNPADGISRLSAPGTAETTDFAHPLNSLEIVADGAGGGDDVIVLDMPDATFAVPLQVRAAGGADQITVSAPMAYTQLGIDGGAGEDVLTIMATTGDDDIDVSESAGEAVIAFTGGVSIGSALTETIELLADRGDDSVNVGDIAAAAALALLRVDGGSGADILDARNHGGTGPSISLDGGDGTDQLFGSPGPDLLIGGGGDDALAGGDGDDVYAFADAGAPETDQVTELAGEGNDALDFTPLGAGESAAVVPGDDTPLATTTDRQINAPAGQGGFIEQFLGPVRPLVVAPIDDQSGGDNDPPRDLADLDEVFLDGNHADADLSYSVSVDTPGIVNLSIDAGTNVLGLAFIEDVVGMVMVTVTAQDPDGIIGTDVFSIDVFRGNRPPFVEMAIEDVEVPASAPMVEIDLNRVFEDEIDGDNLIYTVIGNSDPVIASTSLSGSTLIVTGSAEQPGTTSITIEAADWAFLTVSDTFDFSVLPPPPNMPPTISGLSNITTDEDQPPPPLSFTIADDTTPAGQLIVTATSGNPSLVANAGLGLSGAGAERQLQITPLPDAFGSATIGVTVRDEEGLAFAGQFELVVRPVNDPPTLGPIADVVLQEDVPSARIVLPLVDPDSVPSVQFSADNPALLTTSSFVYDGSTLIITPLPESSGSTLVTVLVDDGGDPVSGQFRVTVVAQNDPPVLRTAAEDIVVAEGSLIDVSLADLFSDPDGDSLSYAIEGLPPGLSFDAGTGRLTGRVDRTSLTRGTVNLVVVARDASGASTAASFRLTLTSAVTDLAITLSLDPNPARIEERVEAVLTVANADPNAAPATIVNLAFYGERLLEFETPAGCDNPQLAEGYLAARCVLDVPTGGASRRFSFTAGAEGEITVAAALDAPADIHLGDNLALVSIAVAGALQTPELSVLGDEALRRVIAADMNADGIPDLVLLPRERGAVQIAHGRGGARFDAPIEIGEPGVFEHVVAADFDADGTLDLAVSGSPSQLLLNRSSAKFELSQTSPNLQGPLAAADLDLDGHADVLAGDATGVRVLAGSDGGLVERAQLPMSAPSRLLAADLDDDGVPDLAIGLHAGAVQLLLNRGGFTFAEAQRVDTGTAVAGLVAADLDGDRLLDLVVGAGAPDDLRSTPSAEDLPTRRVLLNQGRGRFAESQRLGSAPNHDLAVVDLNGDGWPDLAFANGDPGLALYINDGRGRFAPARGQLDSGPAELLVVASAKGDRNSLLGWSGAAGSGLALALVTQDMLDEPAATAGSGGDGGSGSPGALLLICALGVLRRRRS